MTILQNALDNLFNSLKFHVKYTDLPVLEKKIHEWAKDHIEEFAAQTIETKEDLYNDRRYLEHVKRQMAHDFAEALWKTCASNRDEYAPLETPDFKPVQSNDLKVFGHKAKKLSVQLFAFKRKDI